MMIRLMPRWREMQINLNTKSLKPTTQEMLLMGIMFLDTWNHWLWEKQMHFWINVWHFLHRIPAPKVHIYHVPRIYQWTKISILNDMFIYEAKFLENVLWFTLHLYEYLTHFYQAICIFFFIEHYQSWMCRQLLVFVPEI